MCACDRDGLCSACAEREAAEWEQRTLRAELELGHIGGAP